MSTDGLTAHLLRIGLPAALIGGGATLAGYLHDPQAFPGAWLAAYYFWLSMPLGALALLLVRDLTGGHWEALGRRPLSAMAATMPLFIPLFLPVIGGFSTLYPWAQPAGVTLHNRWYLNPGFFFLRTAVYFVSWNCLALWRLRAADPAGAVMPRRPQWLSALGLMLLLYTMTYAGIDWIMSTEPRWFSSIYGMIVCSAQAAAALSVVLLLIAAGRPSQAAAPSAFQEPFAALAAILLAVVIFWAYASFCQWLIMWEANLRTDIHWFIERRQSPWNLILYTVIVAHFAVPLCTLVWAPARRKPLLVGAVCGLLLLGAVLHVWWLLLPGLAPAGLGWTHAATMLTIGGLWALALAGALHLRDLGFAMRRRAERLIHG